MDPWLVTLTQVAILAYAALGGVFLAFSDFIMRALARSPGGAEAMQSINREVFRVVFMALFLGMVPVSVLLALAAWMTAPEPAPLLLAAALYLTGCFAVTAAGNVPLNDRLAAMDAAAPEVQGWLIFPRSGGRPDRVEKTRIGVFDDGSEATGVPGRVQA